MRPKMIFKFGVTVVIAVAVIIVYVRQTDPDKNLESPVEEEKILKTQEEKDNQYQFDIKTDLPSRTQKKHGSSDDRSSEQDAWAAPKEDSYQKEKEKTIKPKKDKDSENIIDETNAEKDDKTVNKIAVDMKLQHDEETVKKGKNVKKEKNVKSEVSENVKNTVEKKTEAGKDSLKAVYFSVDSPPKNSIHLAVVVCGDRMEETLVLLKSAVLFTKTHLVFHLFAETQLQKSFRDKLEFWPQKFLSRVDYFIYNITFPTGDNADQWRTLFKPCASQRLFLPVLLTSVDSLLYVDTDILFLRPLEDLWSFFDQFNSTQLAALSPEHEDAAAGWYNRFARHPYYGKLGLNSGVALMNLTRLRSSLWLSSMLEYFKEYKLKIAWGDQDLINIYFHYYPEQVYVYGCEWNYRPDHCMYMSVCKSAETHGISVLHGNRRVMHNDKQPTFKALYEAFRDHRLGDDIQYKLLVQIERNMKSGETTRCGKVGHIFTKQIETYSKNMRAAEKEKKAQMKEKTNPSQNDKKENTFKSAHQHKREGNPKAEKKINEEKENLSKHTGNQEENKLPISQR